MNTTKQLVFSALFTALVIAGSYVRVPVGPVPIVLASMFILFAGLMQNLKWAMASVLLYLFLGAIGLPVFTAGGGIAYFAGPTGGYLLGYFVAVIVVNLVSNGRRETPIRDLLAVIAGTITIYAIGVPWLKLALDLEWAQAFSSGLLPFLIGDAIKAAVAYSACVTLKRTYPDLIPRIVVESVGE